MTVKIRAISFILGILFILCLPITSGALDSPREILLEADQIITLTRGAAETRTSIPDLDALINRFPGTLTEYAVGSAAQRHETFGRYLLIRLPQDKDDQVSAFLDDLNLLSSVRWAQPNRLLRSHFIPNDPQYYSQWGLQKIHIAGAWDVTTGSAEIPIAIIDTGCEMDHPDLLDNFWRNELEVNGQPGIDDDGNGFVDDSLGWDFVDAPSFPSGGDYLERDNDPSDEMGHGTAVSGVCGAVMNNGVGVAGAAPNCPLMILRAGNMSGFLQEDDVASALLYALDNGARVVNMSFGDTQVSPMLEDVINYAANGGLLMVAAAGNSGSAAIIFPAAFGPTLCVGACDENSQKTTFSSFGTSLDLLAPGANIVSAINGHDYGMFQGGNGTSYAAPFASAVAGLVFSQHPDWNYNEIRSALLGSAEDVGIPGWDPENGQGILRADNAVLVNEALIADITSPIMSQGFTESDTLEIIGTAGGVYIQDFKVYTGAGENPSQWNLIKESEGFQIINDKLVSWVNSEPLDTAYTIRLEVSDIFGNHVDDRVVVYFDPSPPIISDLTVVPILDADRPSYLLSFTTDDLTTGKVWLLGSGTSSWIFQTSGYETTEHIILLGNNLSPNIYSYYVWVINSTGLMDSTAVFGVIDLTVMSMNTNYFVELPAPEIPPSHFLEDITDLDNDGFLEVWADTIDENGAKADLRVYEAASNWVFDDIDLDFGKEIPKSIGDSDADNKPELLTLYAGRTKIFEATQVDGFPQPDNVAWSDSGDVWGTKLLDIIPGGGQGEVILRSGGQYQVWLNWGGGVIQWQQNLTNPINPTPNSTVPYCRAADYDDDGLTELLFGDYDGNLYTYERQSNGSFQVNWSTSLPLLDTGEFLTDGDFNGDGNIQFATLAHTETNITGEHEANKRYWALYIFENDTNDSYILVDTLYFFGAESPSNHASGVSSGDVYAGPEDEIIVCVYPDLYVVSWNEIDETYEVIWYYPECESNNALIGDFDRNGHNEIMINTGTEVRIFEEVGNWSSGPPPPLNFRAIPEPDRINLFWTPIQSADAYNIYKSTYPNPDSLEFLTEITNPNLSDSTFTDFVVIKDTTYYYAISTYDQSGYQSPDGPKSVMISATPNEPPYVVQDTAIFISPAFVTVQFSEPMGSSFIDPNNYWIKDILVQPNSIVSDANDTRAVLTFDKAIFSVPEDTTFKLVLSGILDQQGSQLTALSDTLRFIVLKDFLDPPYLMAAHPSSTLDEVTMFFSDEMDSTELVDKGNYQITADPISGLDAPDQIIITSADVDSSISSSVRLQISSQTPIGSMGKIYRVTAYDLHSKGGIALDSLHNSATINFTQPNLQRTFVYPNPYRNGILVDGEECVVFSNLTQDVEIRILTLQGILIRTLRTTGNVSGGLRWYLDNEYGEQVGSGVYLYYASGAGDTFWGKLAVVR
ncbi:hypothetical protein CEE37_04725 [candidate division LCP-89 bacterium B3_LCP]|uniref:Fibronectin type-III domain-containing protein n=1 Tax=candidate division LCP-89 bacterium B3_LCP TaxID=2012998 RepID=A0A532V4F0_UNCL8|nr:MAG: hypothetical protein CEE37_04725 [candidate division LCP-89 bacterium B3_LCP]